MEQEIRKIIKLAGNEHRYQYLILLLCFLFWGFAPIFSFVLGFLENTPSVSYFNREENETVVEPMDYDICNWNTSSYVVVDTPKYSWVVDLNIECEKMKVSMLGTLASLGYLFGSSTSSTITEKLGQRLTFKILTGIFIVVLLLSIFINHYWFYCITMIIVPFCCNALLFAIMVLFSDIISLEHKSIFNTIINSALGIGGIIFILLFMAFDNWKYVFVVCISMMFITGICAHFFFIESPSTYAKKKDVDGFLKAVRFIAKFNKRLDYFEKEIIKPEYQNILKTIGKGEGDFSPNQPTNTPIIPHDPLETPKQPINHIPTEILDTPNQNNFPTENEVKNDRIDNNDIMINNIEKNEKPKEINEKKEQANHLVESSPMTNIQNTPNNIQKPMLTPQTSLAPFSSIISPNTKPSEQNKKKSNQSKILKTNFWCLIKYPSIRYTFLLLSILWLCTSMLFSGLVIGMKSLPGSIFLNSIILFLAETVGYFCAGPSMNIKKLGRKGALMIYTGGFSLMCFLMVIFINYETLCIVLYIITRFFAMSSFCIYYTFCLESYPTSIKALAYGINGASNNLGGVIIPFIIEYLERRWLYLLYACLGLGCIIILIFLKETLGVIQPDNIREMELEIEKEKIDKYSVVVI